MAPRYRLTLVVALLAGLFIASRYTGIADGLDANTIRKLMDDAGPWGWSLYVIVFAGGEFIHIPGMVFVAAGILVYGKVIGFGLAFFASVISVCFSFLVVRLLGGTPLGGIDRPWLQRVLRHLDARPIRTVFVLRLVLWLAPVLNYALALTSVRFRDYAIGSALGLILPVAGAAILFDWLVTFI
ncbi:MAG: VTT domain-containing protein [Gammaproteobacteria bacterium]|nr:VTT domain-containing protein [Gammaproteobacteria bacterium]